MNLRPYTPVYALTLLLSAALLFSVQPMFSKMILPLLGGTPQVWNTAMLFFQISLLGGYAYAHATSRYLSVHVQAVLHIVLLFIFTIVLPFALPEGWVPPATQDPTLWQLSLMALTVGGPFFVLAGSAPMLQRWFAATDHPDSHNPYFLYGASNLGSMTSLLLYPLVIEPFLNLSDQSQSWMYGYFGLIVFTVLSAALVWRFKARQQGTHNDTAEPVTWAMRARWLLLSFVPSSLMLGVTTYITTDIASVPLLWILPLAIYVGTFILVFARKPLLSLQKIYNGFDVTVLLLLIQLIVFGHNAVGGAGLFVVLHLGVFFFAAMVCHTALAQSRPHTAHLTEFYLLMSLGGALGGFFNAIIASQIFVLPVEYALVLLLAVIVRLAVPAPPNLKTSLITAFDRLKKDGLNAVLTFNFAALCVVIIASIYISTGAIDGAFKYALGLVIFGGLAVLYRAPLPMIFCLGFLFLYSSLGLNVVRMSAGKTLHVERNFFGVVRVSDAASGERIMINGTTDHGRQIIQEKYRLVPIAYYGAESPLADIFEFFQKIPGRQEVGVIGLGAGSMVCYKKDGRHFDFYEIDPKVIEIAQNPDYFTFLSDCGSPYDIIVGDGRMTIAEKPDGHYDIIMVDAFSSDNIPIHIMTKEAIALYLRKLKPDGALVMHISNNYLDLEPVIAGIAENLGIPSLARVSEGGKVENTDIRYHPTHAIVLTHNKSMLEAFAKNNWTPGMTLDNVKIWTDDYSNIVSVLGNKTAVKRYKLSNPELYSSSEGATSPP